MKHFSKLTALALCTMMLFTLAACGQKSPDAGNGGNDAAAPADSLELLTKVWDSYTDDEKFSAVGGDYDHSVDGAPGTFDISQADNVEYMLTLPQDKVSLIDGAASLMHMMNANTFTCGAYHLSDDVSAADVASSLRDNIMNRQWMCGFPDKVVVVTMGQFVVSVYGAEDLVNTFRDKLQNCFSSAVVVYDEPIA